MITSITPTEKPLNVRLATTADEQDLFDMLTQKLYFENGAFSVSPKKVIETIQSATRNQGGIIGVIDGNGEIAGAIGMRLGSFWYSDDWHVEELFNFVAEPYRRSEYAKNLIQFGKWCAERMKLILNIGIISTHRTEAKSRLYSRQLQHVGMFFMHNLAVAKGPALGKE